MSGRGIYSMWTLPPNTNNPCHSCNQLTESKHEAHWHKHRRQQMRKHHLQPGAPLAEIDEFLFRENLIKPKSNQSKKKTFHAVKTKKQKKMFEIFVWLALSREWGKFHPHSLAMYGFTQLFGDADSFDQWKKLQSWSELKCFDGQKSHTLDLQVSKGLQEIYNTNTYVYILYIYITRFHCWR